MRKRGMVSKEQLLSVAKDIINRDGLEALNIRGLAAESGVSVGTIYNYFEDKGELLALVVEDFWHHAVHGFRWQEDVMGFAAFVELFYQRLYEHFQAFEHDWLGALSAMGQKERQQGKQVEAQYFTHIKNGMLSVLAEDTAVDKTLWDDGMTQEGLVELVFDQILLNLRKNTPQCAVLVAMLRKVLYG